MKKLSFLALAIAGMLFAACSSDKDVAGEEGPNPLAIGNKGYFKVNLNMPTTVVTSMRAPGDGWGESSNLDDGLPVEYAVNSVLFLIFEGDNEAEATLKQVMTPTKTISPDPGAGDTPNQITAVKEYVAKLDNAPTNKLFALAVLNGTGIIEAGTVNTAVKLNGVDGDHSGITIADLQVATSNSMKESNYFFMTNAVLSKSQGGGVDPGATPVLQILAPVKSEYIYESETAAEAGVPATDIYVERGVAKVTVKNSITVNAGIQTKDEDAVTATFGGWTLDNTEKESYIVRKVPDIAWNLTSKQAIGTDKYRFVGGNAVDALYGTANLYRTYWAEDPQYSSVVLAANMNRSTNPTFQAGVGDNNPQYCHENTFDVANQTHENTTRIIVKVNLSANDFYTIGADRKTLYSFDNVRDLVVTNLMDQSAFSAYWTTNGGGATLTYAGIDLGDLTAGDAGVIEISDVTIKKEAFATPPANDVSLKNDVAGGSAIINTLNTQLAKVEKFKDGDTYYVIRVQHFGDLLTPWNSSEYKEGFKPVTGNIAAIYPDADDTRQIPNYLGRYGMVRNNWYDITLGEILKIGNSTVPTLPSDTTPDDDLEELYIKARINILSWAKRTQSWTLK